MARGPYHYRHLKFRCTCLRQPSPVCQQATIAHAYAGMVHDCRTVCREVRPQIGHYKLGQCMLHSCLSPPPPTLQLASFPATAGALEHGGRGGAAQWTTDRNGASAFGDDMPNMGTVQMTNGFSGIGLQGLQARGGLEYTSGNRTNASDSPLMGSVNLGNSRTIRAVPAGPLGMAPTSSPARPPSSNPDDRPIMGYKFVQPSDARRSSMASAPAATADLPGARGYQPSAMQSPAPSHARGAHHHHHHRHHAANGDDDDEGAYSDDFEEDDDDEGVVQQRNRIIQNVEGELRALFFCTPDIRCSLFVC